MGHFRRIITILENDLCNYPKGKTIYEGQLNITTQDLDCVAWDDERVGIQDPDYHKETGSKWKNEKSGLGTRPLVN